MMYKTTWLIDDNEIDNFLNKKHIINNNFSERVVEFNLASAAEAEVENLLKNSMLVNVPDFIFLDLNMPVYSGMDFMKKCDSKLHKLNPEIKIVVLTSSINPDDEQAVSLFSSFCAFVNKPLNADKINKLKA